jgi:hypothetical protein
MAIAAGRQISKAVKGEYTKERATAKAIKAATALAKGVCLWKPRQYSSMQSIRRFRTGLFSLWLESANHASQCDSLEHGLRNSILRPHPQNTRLPLEKATNGRFANMQSFGYLLQGKNVATPCVLEAPLKPRVGGGD